MLKAWSYYSLPLATGPRRCENVGVETIDLALALLPPSGFNRKKNADPQKRTCYDGVMAVARRLVAMVVSVTDTETPRCPREFLYPR